MPMYNLIEYSDNYSKTSGSLMEISRNTSYRWCWEYCRF